MAMFKRNMGTLDRSVRFIVGVTLLLIGPVGHLVTLTPVSEILLGVLGALALISSLMAYCLFYELTGSNTKKAKSN